MKWLLLNPRPEAFRVLGKYEPVMVPFAPMGLAYLAACLEAAGHEVAVHDEFVESPDAFAPRLRGFRPDAVGISCLTPAMHALPSRIAAIRAQAPRAAVVCGNIHATLFYREILEQGLADFVVRGEGEEAVVALSELLSGAGAGKDVAGLAFRENGTVRAGKGAAMVQDLDGLPPPAWHLLNLDRYIAPPMFSFKKRLLPVLASRGCPFSCYFCAQNVLSPRLRKRDPVLVAQEMEDIYRRFGVDLFWFADAIFPLCREDGEIFCREMHRRGLTGKVSWITETRVDMVERDLIRTMKRAGLHMLIFGLESGDEAMLRRVKPGLSLEAGRRAVAAARKENVLTLGLFILGLPGETRESMARTLKFSRSVGLDFAKFTRAVPYPGSAFFNDVNQGRPVSDWKSFHPNREPGPEGGLAYCPPGMSEQELVRAQKRAFLGFYLRPGLAVRHLCKGTISPENMLRGGRALLGIG
ncbi:MAG: radical SAM protein [Thermodesulfobacteriota bacterium]